MADPIIIKIGIDRTELTREAEAAARQIKSAIDGVFSGGKPGEQFTSSITSGLANVAEQVERLRNTFRSREEARELKHQQKLVEIQAKSEADKVIIAERNKAKLVAIESKAAADRETIAANAQARIETLQAQAIPNATRLQTQLTEVAARGVAERRSIDAQAEAQRLTATAAHTAKLAEIGAKERAERTIAESKADLQIQALLAKGATDSSKRVQAIRSQGLRDLEVVEARAAAARQQAEISHQATLTQIVRTQSAARAEAEVKAETAAAVLRNKTTEAGSRSLEFFKKYASTIREAGESIQQAGLAFTRASNVILSVGRAALNSAIDIDKNRQILIALTRSVDKANAKLLELRRLAAASPGLTNSLAATLFAQFKALGDVADPTINKLLQSIGRLNAVFTIQEPQRFARNLVQLVTGNFNTRDIREALNQVPVFNQFLERAFGTSDPKQLRKLREAGKITSATFLEGFANAVLTDPAFGNIQEALGLRIEKIQSQILDTLAPLGAKIGDTLIPILQRIVPIVSDLVDRFRGLSPGFQDFIVKAGLLSIALGPLVVQFGAIVQAIGAVGNLLVIAKLATGFTAFATAATGATAAIQGTTVATVGLRAAITGFFASNPIGLILLLAGAVTAVTVGYFAFRDSAEEAARKQAEFNKSTLDAAEPLRQQLDDLRNLRESSGDLSLSQDHLLKIYKDLDPIAQARVKALADEKGGVEDLNALLPALINNLGQEYELKLKLVRLQSQDRAKEIGNAAADITSSLENQELNLAKSKENLARLIKLQEEAKKAGTGTILGLTPNFGTAKVGGATFKSEIEIAAKAVQDLEEKVIQSKLELKGLSRELVNVAKTQRLSSQETVDFLRNSVEGTRLNGKALEQFQADINELLVGLAAQAAESGVPSIDRGKITGGVGDGKGESKARQIRNRQLALAKEIADNAIKIAEDAAKREQDALQRTYDAGVISTTDYYTQRLRIAQQASNVEITAVRGVIKVLEEQQKKAKGPAEKLQREKDLADARKNLTLATLKLTDAETENFRGYLTGINQVIEGLQASGKVALEQQLRLSEDAIQRELGVLQRGYDNGLISAQEFYDKKAELTRRASELEIAFLKGEEERLALRLKKTVALSAQFFAVSDQLRDVRARIVIAERNQVENTLKSVDEARKARIEDIEKARDTQLARFGTAQARIQNQINQGILTEAEGRKQILAIQRQERDARIAALVQEKAALGETNGLRRAQIDQEIESIRLLGEELDNAQRFMRGFGKETETVGDIFERFGNNVARSFKNVGTLLDSLKSAVKDFFKDLVGNILQNAVRGILGTLFGQTQRGGGGGSVGGGGIVGSILGAVTGNPGIARQGGIFRTPDFNPNGGGGASATSIIPNIGSIFRTPGFNPNTTGATSSPLGNIRGLVSGLGSFFGFGGQGVDVPQSVLTPPIAPGTPIPGVSVRPDGVSNNGSFGRIAALGDLFRNLTKGIGFGLPAGSARGGLAQALPLLGAGLGASLGGQSRLGNVLGGIGGGLLGVGLTAAPAGLAGFSPLLAGLFSNPITAAIGAVLLPTAFLLGRAKQRRADERSSGDFLQDAVTGINQLARDVAGDRIDGGEARSIFENEILRDFIEKVKTLKTKSVRESRLTNQVQDLRNLFDAVVTPNVENQSRRRIAFERQIPEFATGGVVGLDPIVARLHPLEIVLNREQQAEIARLSGLPDIFRAAGVPGANRLPELPRAASADTLFTPGGFGIPATQADRFIQGGRGGDGTPVIIIEGIEIYAGDDVSSQIVIKGARTRDGRKALVKIKERDERSREV